MLRKNLHTICILGSLLVQMSVHNYFKKICSHCRLHVLMYRSINWCRKAPRSFEEYIIYFRSKYNVYAKSTQCMHFCQIGSMVQNLSVHYRVPSTEHKTLYIVLMWCEFSVYILREPNRMVSRSIEKQIINLNFEV